MTDMKCPFNQKSYARVMSLVGLMLSGCGHHGAAKVTPTPDTRPMTLGTSPATQPAPATVPSALPMQTYSNTSAGIQFSYPASWNPEKAETAVLSVAAPVGTAAGYSSLSLDIPKLPWHIRNMIPMMAVAHDYISDLKKNQIPDAVVQEQTDLNIPDTTARRITCAGHEKGKTSIDVAVILIHADQVFILSADSDDAGRVAARQAMDTAVASLKWTK